MRIFQAALAGLGTMCIFVLFWHAALCALFDVQDYFTRSRVKNDLTE